VVLASGRGEVLEILELLATQFDRVCADVLLKAYNAFGSWDRCDVVALGQQPRDGDLRRCGTDLCCDGGDLVGQAQVLIKVLAGEAGVGGAEVVAVEMFGGANCARQEAMPQREYGTKPIPSSRRSGSTAGSGSRVHSEYSDCSAVIGYTALA